MRKAALFFFAVTAFLALLSHAAFAQDYEQYKCVSPGIYACHGEWTWLTCTGTGCVDCDNTHKACPLPSTATEGPQYDCGAGTFSGCTFTFLDCSTLYSFKVKNCSFLCVCPSLSGISFPCYTGSYRDSCTNVL